MKRPMLYWVVLFVLGEVVSAKTLIALIMAGCYMIALCVIRHPQVITDRRLYLIGVLFFFFGFISMWRENKKIELCDFPDNTEVVFSGKVVDRYKRYAGRYRVRVDMIDNISVHAYILIESDDELILGCHILGNGKVKPYMTASNYGQFDQREYELSLGNVLHLDNVNCKVVRKPMPAVREWLKDVNEYLGLQFDMWLSEKNASLAKAMVLGDREDIDQDIQALYRRSGIAHLIAISGLHIAMFGGAIYHFIRSLTGSYKIAGPFGIVFIILYGMLTGLSGATMRAMIMLIMVIIADILGRKNDPVTAMAVALLIMLVSNPYGVRQAGFLLSFGAVTGIAVVYPVVSGAVSEIEENIVKHIFGYKTWNLKRYMTGRPVSKLLRNITGKSGKESDYRHSIRDFLVSRIVLLFDGILLSICVQIAIIPVILYYFYEIPVYGVLLNVIVVPLMSVLLGVLVIIGISGGIGTKLMGLAGGVSAGLLGSAEGLGGAGVKLSGFLGGVCAKLTGLCVCVAEKIFGLYEVLCKLTEKMPHNIICTGRPDMIWIFTYYGLVAVTLWLIWHRKKKLLVVTFTLWGILLLVPLAPGKMLINVFDVGQGDGIYIRTSMKRNILIDGGSSSKKNVGTYILKNGVKYYGAGVLDYVIVTHSDSDHYSGVKELLESADVGVRNFVLPYIDDPDDAYRELEDAALRKGCDIHYIRSGDNITVGDVRFHCLNPGVMSHGDKNQNSIVLWMQYGSFDMLLTGDIDSSVEEHLIEDKAFMGSIRAGNSMEVLKVAHHGSAGSSSEEFLRNTGFDVSIISVGEKNHYGHPAPETIKRLNKYCSYMYLTKDSGAVTIRTDGRKYSMHEYVSDH